MDALQRSADVLADANVELEMSSEHPGDIRLMHFQDTNVWSAFWHLGTGQCFCIMETDLVTGERRVERMT